MLVTVTVVVTLSYHDTSVRATAASGSAKVVCGARRQLGNSVLIAAITMAVVVPCASLAAFVLARYSFRGREAVYALFTLGLLFPLTVSIIVLRPFFRSIPAELEEAAAMDGCGPFRFFVRIALPMSRPVLATVSVLAIVASWNAFLLPLVVLSDPEMCALVFYVVAERQIVSGLASGAVKG